MPLNLVRRRSCLTGFVIASAAWVIPSSPGNLMHTGLNALSFIMTSVLQRGWARRRWNHFRPVLPWNRRLRQDCLSRPHAAEPDRLAREVEPVPAFGQTFNTADYVDGFTVFDVGGNQYRIATVIHYDKQRNYVRAVMTHAEYDRNNWRQK